MRPKKLVGELKEKAQEMLSSGVTRKRICEELGIHINTLRNEFGSAWTQKKKESEIGTP